MDKTITIKANADGEYWLDAEVAGERKKVLIDTGYSGTGGFGACTVTEENWEKMKDRLREKGKGGSATDYKGDQITPQYGKGTIKIIGLDTEVEKFITFSGSQNDLFGTTFLHNLKDVVIEWNLRDQTMTLKEKARKAGGKEEQKKMKEQSRSFDEQLEKNRVFYAQSKERLAEQYGGQYVVIADGELKDVRDSYDGAVARSADFEDTFLSVMVFKAGEEASFGAESHGLRTARGPVEGVATG